MSKKVKFNLLSFYILFQTPANPFLKRIISKVHFPVSGADQAFKKKKPVIHL